MRQSQGFPPNLFRSSIPWHGIGSKDWVPTNYVQRVVAFIFGVIYIVGAGVCMASTVFFRGELTTELRSEVAGVVIGFLLVCVVLIGGAIVMALGVRLLRGALRPDTKSS